MGCFLEGPESFRKNCHLLTLAAKNFQLNCPCFQGCVDEYEKCPQWSRSGFCEKFTDFMFFNCRESCGGCGFKSRK